MLLKVWVSRNPSNQVAEHIRTILHFFFLFNTVDQYQEEEPI